MGKYKGTAHMLFLYVNYSEGMSRNIKRNHNRSKSKVHIVRCHEDTEK